MALSTHSQDVAHRALVVTETRRVRFVEDAEIQRQIDMFHWDWRYVEIDAGRNPGRDGWEADFRVWMVANYPDFTGLARGRNLI